MLKALPIHLQDLIGNSPYCLPYNSWCWFREFDIGSKNNPVIDNFFILFTCLLDIVLIW